MKNAVLFWSGGKDSAFALYQVQQNYPHIEIKYLVTTLNEEYRRISMHGITEELLDRQAAQIGIPLRKMWVPNEPTNQSYEKTLLSTYRQLKDEGIDTIIYGDIFLEDLRIYREKLLAEAGLTGYFPLWKLPTDKLIREFLDLGFRTITCCISTAYLTESWLEKEIDADFIKRLPKTADPCGENGEFHTFCFDGPVFKDPVQYKSGERQFKPLQIKTTQNENNTGFWYLDLL